MDSRTWYVFATDAGLRVVHSRNQVGSRVPLERTIEVPTGISPESWAALQKQASTALRTLSVSAVTEADAIDAKKP
jgi:hypothetical protein